MSILSKDEKKQLTELQQKVMREKGTETPFSGALLENDEAGDYICADCSSVLFSSQTKYNSRTGWPSFYDKAHENATVEIEDTSLGMRRVEVCCKNCNAHLGHVFPDGPEPTGLRYCINSASLDFQKNNTSS